jgi:chromosome segregation ATPase
MQGFSYDQIATETGLSTGSVANIVSEAKEGKFAELNDVREQIDGLREVSVELRKNNLKVSQALLGLSFYERITKLGIEPAVLDRWIRMCHQISSPDCPIEEFVAAALRLKELELQKGMTYEALVEDYEAKAEALSAVESRISELERSSGTLSQEVHNLSEGKRSLETAVRELDTEKKPLSQRVKRWKEEEEELKNTVSELQKRRKALQLESQRLETRAAALSEEIGERDGTLNSLRSLGFGEGELLRLKDKLEELAANRHIKPAELRESLFLDLENYPDVLSFRNERRELTQAVKGLREQKQTLEAENKNLQEGIGESRKAFSEAVQHIKGREKEIVSSMDSLLGQAGGRLNKSVSQAASSLNEFQANIESAGQDVRSIVRGAVVEAIEYGKAMGRMEKVVSEREELVKLFGILGDVSAIPRDVAVKAPLVVLGRFHEWAEKTHGLKDESKVFLAIDEMVALLRLEAA